MVRKAHPALRSVSRAFLRPVKPFLQYDSFLFAVSAQWNGWEQREEKNVHDTGSNGDAMTSVTRNVIRSCN